MRRARRQYEETIVELRNRPPSEEVNDAGVTVADALTLFVPPEPPPPGYTFERDVAFGRGGADGPVLDLQLYRPDDVREPRPGIVFVHGGAFREGFPEVHASHAHTFAASGYVTASIDYRVASEACWPAALEDAKCAVRWMRASSEALGVDPDRIAVVGGSAGGHLAAMVALTPGRFEGDGGHLGHSSEVAAAVVFYPVTDMTWPGLADDIKQCIADFVGSEDEAVYREASPVEHVSAACPPILCLTGDRDREVPVEMVRSFHERLAAAGVNQRLEVFPGRAHSFDYSLDDWRASVELMRGFLDENLH